jgi:gliding motility-associated-like protein
MKKITFLLLFTFFTICGYSQFTEGFESTTGPDALPSTNWTLGSGNWAVFDNAIGTAQRWGNAPVATPSNAYQGDNAAYINRENLGTEGFISQDYLSTPLVTIPANGQLRFFARSFASGNQGTLYQIRVAPATAAQTNLAAYTLVQQWDETTLNTTFNIYEEKVVDLSAYATQQVYVSFVRVHTQLPGGINGAGDRWLVDNVTIVERCLDPTALTFSAITPTGVTLNWANPSGATSWEIEIIPATGTPTGVGTIYNGTLPYVVTGLLANTAYKYYVRAICNTGYSSAWVGPSANFTTGTAPPVCGGNFVDPGGPTANYANNVTAATGTTTICPTNPGDLVTITFTAFALENNFDFLRIYDGNNATAPLLASLTGTALPPSFTSTAASGCLTFVFTSDGSVTAAGWIANITCAPPPVCQQPNALVSSAVTSNSATLAWTNVGVATSWEVLALPCGSPAPTEATTGWTATTTNPYTFTGLTSATCYNLYVRGNCSSTSNGVSLWSGPRSITTQVAPPVCGGNFVDPGGPTANYANNITAANGTTTICPTNPGDVVTVTFTSFALENNFDFLRIYDGNSAAATQIANLTGTALPPSFSSTATNGCLTFVFTSDGSVTAAGWIANVTCAPPPACQQPTALVSSAVTSNSATLAWTNVGVATSWEVLALPCGSPAPTEATTGFIATSTNPYIFTGLSSATCYNLYVRSNCSSTSNGVSLWSGPRTITTQVAPPVCGGNFVDAAGPTTNYANNSNVTTTICPTNPGEIVTVTFTSFDTEVNFDGLYVYDGNAVVPANQIASANPAGFVPGGLAGSYWGTTIPGPFTSTTADGCLTFVFRSDGSVTRPGWIANITCSPAPTCARPTLVTATSVTQTSAILNWTQPLNPNGSIATAWEVLVLPAGSPVPTTNGIPATSPYTATGLSAGTAYVFYVRAICSSTDSSAWSALNFAALPVNDECSNATFAIVNQNLNCVQTTPGTLSGATASLPTTTCPGVANDDVWFSFTATAVTHIISFNNVSLPAPTLNYAIFSGTDCGTLTQVGCNSGANLIPGTTYFIRVYSATAVPQFTTFNLCIGTLPCTEAPAFCTGQTVTYANATNVPSLGTIGCLGTSPNPAFFFLQVNQAGPLSYLISQVDTNGIPRDVDYVAWGPFTDLTTACSGVPANPLPGAVPIPTPTTGCPGTLHACSYSTAAQEIMCIPNAQLCQVYVIMITNFSNQAGTVTFTQTNTGGGTTECFPINTFNYPQTYYCQDGGANPTPVLAPGAAAGTYTSTPGLVINPVTGVIDLAASTPGPYIVTSTTLTSTGGVCTNIPSITTTRTVIITAAASATISYASPTYCNNITSFENPTLTGTTGGVFSASPSGLLINPVTGGILPIASTPGLYTVTYTKPAFGGCVAFTTTAPVEILATPIIVQPAPVSICNTYTLPALTVGNYYSQSGGQGTPLDINVPITSSQTVYIYAQSNGCSSEKSFTVTINSASTPTLNITQPTCEVQSGTIEVTAPLSPPVVLPSNLFISEVTDEDVGSLTYIEIYNGTGSSVDLSNYKLKVYNNGSSTASCDNQLTGILNNNTTFIVAVGSTTNQGGVVPNQVFATCGGVNTDDNIRLTTSSDVEIDNWGRTDGVAYTPSNQAGYTYRRNNTATVPNLTWNTSDWTAIDPQDYTNVGSYTPLVIGYQYSLDNGTYQASTTFSNVIIGNHTITVLDLATGCLSVPLAVIIDPVPIVPTVTTFSYTSPVCFGEANPLPVTSALGFTSGGTYSCVDTAISIDAVTGEIDLSTSTPGTYTITYEVFENATICQVAGSSTAQIVISEPIQINVEAGCQSINYVLTALPIDNSFNPESVIYSWQNGNGVIVGNTQSITVTETGSYFVSVTSEGCLSNSLPVSVDAINCVIQKGISVNGDGKNDTFDLTGFNVKNLSIFNRYGEKVYSYKNYTNQWGGQSDNGDELPDGTYYYVINRDNGETKTGWIYINRAQ